MKRFFVFALTLLFIGSAFAQEAQDAGQYLDELNKYFYDINKAMWKYMKVSAHSNSQSRQQAKKQDLIKTIEKTREQIAKMPPFEGDPTLRDSVIAYLDFAKAFIKGDLTRLEELQAKASKSYEDMLKYFQKQALINKKYEQRFNSVNKLLENFAKAHNINLVDATDKLSQKIDKANRVVDYSNKLYLIYLKPYMTATFLYKAIGEDDLPKIKALYDSLLTDVARSQTLLANIGDFEGDAQLKTATEQALGVLKDIALNYIPNIFDFYELKEQISKQDSLLKSKTQDQWTQEEVDKYNQLVNQYNIKVAEINQTLEQIRQTLTTLDSKYEQVRQEFLDYHTPR